MDPREALPTRSSLLELRDEHGFVREGLELLDQKRTLLAGELLRWLPRYEQARSSLLEAHHAARKALVEAAARHGIDELAAQPPVWTAGRLDGVDVASFLGVPIVSLRVRAALHEPGEPPPNPSPEARRAAAAFARVIDAAAALAAPEANLRRLFEEFRRTERRARALQNVILPELAATVKQIDEALEEQDQEDAVRVRLAPR